MRNGIFTYMKTPSKWTKISGVYYSAAWNDIPHVRCGTTSSLKLKGPFSSQRFVSLPENCLICSKQRRSLFWGSVDDDNHPGYLMFSQFFWAKISPWRPWKWMDPQGELGSVGDFVTPIFPHVFSRWNWAIHLILVRGFNFQPIWKNLLEIFPQFFDGENKPPSHGREVEMVGSKPAAFCVMYFFGKHTSRLKSWI